MPIKKFTHLVPLTKEYAYNLMNMILILYAEHGMNNSTFSTLVVGSAYDNPIPAGIVAGILSLKGNRYGEINIKVINFLTNMPDNENEAYQFLLNHLQKRIEFPGVGHRIYRAPDPRFKIMYPYFLRIYRPSIHEKKMKIYISFVEKYLSSKGVYPNVGLLSGYLLNYLSIPTSYFALIFLVSRLTGWLTHLWEYGALGGSIVSSS